MGRQVFAGAGYRWKAIIPAAAVAMVFTSLVAYLSLTNHALFRTYALDLGVFNHALYQITQWQNPAFTLGLDGQVVPFLADHFSPLVYVLAWPYAWVGSSYLLWVQVLLVPVFCLYAWRLALSEGLPLSTAWMVPLSAMTCWAVYAAYGFDFHMNVLAAMLVVPYWYSLRQKKWVFAVMLWLVILTSKENMALWLFFITTAACFSCRDRFSAWEWRGVMVLAILALVYFVAVVTVVMPGLHPGNQNVQLSKYVGSEAGLSGVIGYCLNNPLEAIGLVVNAPDGEVSDSKLGFLRLLLLSGGLALLLSPRALWMSVPLFAQKFLSVNPGFWAAEAQYSIEFVPLMVFALIDVVRGHKVAGQMMLLGATIMIASWATMTIYMPKSNRSNIFSHSFNQVSIDVEQLRTELAQVPPGISLCSSTCLAPHLSDRHRIYHFPFVEDADGIAVLRSGYSTYPMQSSEYGEWLRLMDQNPEWTCTFRGKEILIYQRSATIP